MWAGPVMSARNDVMRCLHRLRATSHLIVLPPPPGEVAAGRRGVVRLGVGGGVWEVVRYVVRGALYVVGGWNRARHSRWRVKSLPQATGHKPRAVFQTPTPALPQGEGALFCGDRAVDSRRGMGPGPRAQSALGRGLVSPFRRLNTDSPNEAVLPVKSGGHAEAMATIN